MPTGNWIYPITLSSINANTLTGDYAILNGTGLPEACSIIRIINDSDKAIGISFDGSVSHDYISDGHDLQLYFQISGQPSNYRALAKKGQKIYVKSIDAAAGTGTIAITGYYQSKK